MTRSQWTHRGIATRLGLFGLASAIVEPALTVLLRARFGPGNKRSGILACGVRDTRGWLLGVNDLGNLHLTLHDGGGNTVVAGPAVRDNAWRWIGLQYGDGNAWLLVDGRQYAAAGAAVTLPQAADGLRIGTEFAGATGGEYAAMDTEIEALMAWPRLLHEGDLLRQVRDPYRAFREGVALVGV